MHVLNLVIALLATNECVHHFIFFKINENVNKLFLYFELVAHVSDVYYFLNDR